MTQDRGQWTTNEVTNQEILRKFVDREIIMNASGLVQDGSEKLLFNSCSIYEVAENLTIDEEEAIDAGFASLEEAQAAGEDFKEVFEWWFVSEFLYEKLKDLNCVVYDSDYGYLWGRETTGQAISMDSVIETIAKDMEILNGQKYSWA